MHLKVERTPHKISSCVCVFDILVCACNILIWSPPSPHNFLLMKSIDSAEEDEDENVNFQWSKRGEQHSCCNYW